MLYLKNITLFLLLGFVQQNFGQHKTQFHFKHLSEDEFRQGEKTFIYQDSYGLVWISSRRGLNCFNGQTLRAFEYLSDQSITSACLEDKKRDLWFSTFDGICCYQRKADAFKTFRLKNSGRVAYNNDYYAFHLDKHGFIWVRIGTSQNGYLYLFNTENGDFRPLCPLQGERCYVVRDKMGEVTNIISTFHNNGSGLGITDVKTGKFKKKEFSRFSNGKKIINNVLHTNSAHLEGDSVIWVSVYDGIGVYYPKRDTAWVILDRDLDKVKIENEEIGEIWDIAPYGDRYILASSEEAGLLLFDKQNLCFVDQILADGNNPFGIRTNFLKELYIDRYKNIWLAENRRGLAYANLFDQKIGQIPEMKEKYISAIHEDHQKNIWCSTLDSGIYIFNQRKELLHHALKFENAAYASNADLPELSLFFEDTNQNLWSVYMHYLLSWNPIKRIFHFEGKYILPKNDNINFYFQTKSGKKLFAIRNLILEFDFTGNYFTHRPYLNLSPYQLQNITSFYQDARGYYYIADNYHRLLIVQEKNGQLKKVQDFDNVGECHAFYEDQSKLWIASSKGLFSLDKQAIWTRQKSKLQAATQLPRETFYTIIPDAKGYLWLTSNNGLIRYHTQQKGWDRFSQADGLQSQEFSPRASLKASNGEIWLGGPNGLNVFHPDSIQNQSSFPPLMIEQIKVNDLDYKIGQNVQLLQKIPKLRHQENTLSFNFMAIEYNDPEVIQLKYRLIGQDVTWIETQNPGFVRFSKLPPGAYTLEIIATNADGVWMPESAAKKLSFYVPTPWYRTWWFYLLCIATVTAITYGIFNYRLQQALKIERIRVRISSDLHDDVGTILSGLAMQSEILELTAPEKTKPKLQRISELSRSAMSRMRDTVWAIDARKDKLENLIDRMREHAEETLTPKDIILDLEVDQLALTKNIPSQIRQALYLIYKEAITNCAKHSKGDKVSVRMQKFGPKGLEMSIHDNGEVQQKAYKTTGSGLSNMRMRAEQIGGTFQVDASQGFLITVLIPHFS